MKTRWICINGHNQPAPGQKIGLLAHRAIHECAAEGCRAEAEPITVAEQHIAAGHHVTADWTILYQHSTELDADTGTLRILTDTSRATDGSEGETELYCHDCLDTVQPSDWTKVDFQ